MAEIPPALVALDIAALVAEHHVALYRYALGLTGAPGDAEDLTQQTFLVAQQKLAQLRDVATAKSWLFTILRNAYLKSFRKPAPLTAGSIDLDLNAIAEDLPEELWIDSERLQAALDELPSEFKVVLLMFYFEDLSYREIADQLDLPAGTVMSRLSRAKGRLRARLLDTEWGAAAGRLSGELGANGISKAEGNRIAQGKQNG